VICAAVLGLAHCSRSVMPDERMTVSWSVSGMPPAYTERRWRADVPAPLVAGLNALLQKARFFDLPADMGANTPLGRDMGSYSITVTAAARTHTVRFSDSSGNQDLANVRAWLTEHLASTASAQ